MPKDVDALAGVLHLDPVKLQGTLDSYRNLVREDAAGRLGQ